MPNQILALGSTAVDKKLSDHMKEEKRRNSVRVAVTEMIAKAIKALYFPNVEEVTITVDGNKKRRGKVAHGNRVGECRLGTNAGRAPDRLPDGTVEGQTVLGKQVITVPLRLYPGKQADQLTCKNAIGEFIAEKYIHAATGSGSHGKAFAAHAKRIGFQGHLTNVDAGKKLKNAIAIISASTPDLPIGTGDGKESRVQQQYNEKFSCNCEDEVPIRITASAFEKLKARGLMPGSCNKCGSGFVHRPKEAKTEEQKVA
jgi:hypothetical protein